MSSAFLLQDKNPAKEMISINYEEYKEPLWTNEDYEYFYNKVTEFLLQIEFNGNIYISFNGDVLYDRCFGFADLKNAIPSTKETVFQLASISKTYTSTAILLLQEDSLLNINDKVVKHIQEFPYPNITIKQLLTHTSGLQNYMFLIEKFWKKSQYPNNEDVLNLFIEQKRPLNFTPGEKFEYSNSGYVFLGLIIERVSKMSYAQFLEKRVFIPLGLSNTFVYDIRKPKENIDRAKGFRKTRNSWRIIPEDNLDAVFGDKGVYSNIPDLLKWDRAFYENSIIPEEVAKEAFEFQRLVNDSIVEYGYGWRLQDVFGIKAVHHPGRWKGFRTSFKRFTDRNATLIILSNNNTDIADLVDSIQSLLFKNEKEAWLLEQQLRREALILDSINRILSPDSIFE
ncbi:MAG: beta-lactamase family protein [Bacteroidetes bacterium]|nr:beta-lactamase family protein [Bacteroidota bacterium]